MENPIERPGRPGKNAGFAAAGVFAFIVAGAMISANARPAQSQPPNAGAATQTAGQKYKNIRVLKDIPADQLIPSVQFITAALGVECGFCHVATPAGKL